MAAFIKPVSRSSISLNAAMFCGACLFVFLLSAAYGLDLSPGFF